MRANVQAVVLTDGKVPDLRARPRQPRAAPQLVDVQQAAPREAIEVALALAHGDSSRLSFLPDGTVLISNRPRPAQRTREAPR